MTTRPRAEIMKDLHAILAELEHSQHVASLDLKSSAGEGDLSPKLAQALGKPNPNTEPLRHNAEPELTHEDIRQKARAFKAEKPERLKDYRPADDPNWDEAVFMGTGDRKPD